MDGERMGGNYLSRFGDLVGFTLILGLGIQMYLHPTIVHIIQISSNMTNIFTASAPKVILPLTLESGSVTRYTAIVAGPVSLKLQIVLSPLNTSPEPVDRSPEQFYMLNLY